MSFLDRGRHIVDRVVPWNQLRAIGNSPVVRSSIIMPVVGYLLLLNQNILNAADIDPRFRLIASGSPWRLLMIYYGTFGVGVASVIYLLRCPSEVRKYESLVDFRNGEHAYFESDGRSYKLSQIVKSKLATMVGAKLSLLTEQIEPEDESRFFRLEEKYPELFGAHNAVGLSPNSRNVSTDTMMTYYWHVQNLSRRVARMLCAIFYCAGFLALLVPTVVTFAGVSRYAYQLFFGL